MRRNGLRCGIKLAAMAFAAAFGGQAAAGPITVTESTSGTSGDYTLNFTITNNIGGDQKIYIFGVSMDSGTNFAGSPPTFPTHLDGLSVSQFGGSSTIYNNAWLDNVDAGLRAANARRFRGLFHGYDIARLDPLGRPVIRANALHRRRQLQQRYESRFRGLRQHPGGPGTFDLDPRPRRPARRSRLPVQSPSQGLTPPPRRSPRRSQGRSRDRSRRMPSVNERPGRSRGRAGLRRGSGTVRSGPLPFRS